MATKNGNPFAQYDVTKMFPGFDPKIFASFDPAKVAEDFTKLASQVKMPTVDMDAVVSAGRKNFEALSAANQVAVEGSQALAQRQAEFAQKSIDEVTKAVESIGTAKTPQDAAAKQVEVLKASYEGALANAKELSDLFAKSQAEAFAALNARVTEQLEEIQTVTKTAAK